MLKGDDDAAIRDFDKAIALDPDCSHAYHNRADAYCRKGDYEKAWADVKTCLEKDWIVDPEFLLRLRQSSGRQN